MLLAAWVLVAGAVEPPPGVDVDDPYHWDDAARKILDGPPGCHDATGIARFGFTLYQSPDWLSAARLTDLTFGGHVTGRLVDGVWETFDAHLVQMQPPPDPSADPDDAGSDLLPLIGARKDKHFQVRSKGSQVEVDGDDVPLNLVRAVIDEWGGSQETVYARWDGDKAGVVLDREVPISKSNNKDTSKVEAFFPGGGTVPVSFDVTFPPTVTVGTWPARAKLQSAQMHIRQDVRDGAATPTFESTSVVVTFFGFTVGIEQTIAWQGWTACGG